MKTIKVLFIILCLFSFTPAFAKLVQIIHTNDLHSFFQGPTSGGGGYARLKTIIDGLKADAEARHIPSLYLDGGDFGEGSSFYFSNQGVDSMRALDQLGVDITVLGNHDFLLGSKELYRQLTAAKMKAKIISANVQGKRTMKVDKLMPDYVDLKIHGMKVRVMGLTTSQYHYKYPLRPAGIIFNSHNTGMRQARKAKRDDVDFMIALTHIGLKDDIKLVEKSKSIDLVVGGHSHTKIPEPRLIRNKNGREVPIVQAGAHSLYVGSILLDMQPGGKSKIIDYRLYDVTQDIPEDQTVKAFVDQAYENRDRYFNRPWDEVIGFSDIPLTGMVDGHQREQRSCWSRHIARLTRVTAKTDIGIQFDAFQGQRIPEGPITFGNIIDNFPHFRQWGDKGWSVARVKMNGNILKSVLKLMAGDQGKGVTIDGLQVAEKGKKGLVHFELGKHNLDEAILSDGPIVGLKYYSVGVPSEIPYAMLKMLSFIGYFIFQKLEYVPNSDYWTLLEKYVADNTPLRCLPD